MGEVLPFLPLPKDGGKARIRRRREALALSAKAILSQVDDLVMHRPDPEDTAPSELA